MPNPDVAGPLPAAEGASGSLVDPRIMAAMMRLPARQRQVVALRLVLDLDTSHTAELLGITPSSSRAAVTHAPGASSVRALSKPYDPSAVA